jgi:hypothetical protein
MRRAFLGSFLLGFGSLTGLGSDPPAGGSVPKLPAIPPISPNTDWGESAATPNWKKATYRTDDHGSDDPKPTANPPAVLPKPRGVSGSGSTEKATADAKALKEEMEKLLKLRQELQPDGEPGGTDERTKLRSQLNDLLKKLDQPKSKSATEKEKPHATPPKMPLLEGGKPIDAMRLAINAYKAGEVKAALEAFRLIDQTKMSAEERAFTQYLIACCLRQTGKVSEATAIYREILNEKADSLLTECALTQLGLIQSTRELDAQLEQLRARRKGK